MAIEGLTVGKINQLLNNYLQGKSDGTGSTKVKHPIQTVLNGANAQVTKILQNNGSETQLYDETEITTNENNAAELEITISGTLSTEGIDNEKAANNLKSTGNYKVFFNDAVPPYVTKITDAEDTTKLKFQSLTEGWNFKFENDPYPKRTNAFDKLFKFENTGNGFSYSDYAQTKERKVSFGLKPDNITIQATEIFENIDASGNSKTVKATYKKDEKTVNYKISKRSLTFKRGDDNDESLVAEEKPPFQFKTFSKTFEIKDGVQQPKPIFGGDVSLELGSDEATKTTIDGSITSYQQESNANNESYVAQLGLKVQSGDKANPLFPEIMGTSIGIQSSEIAFNYKKDISINAKTKEPESTNELKGRFEANINITDNFPLTGEVQWTGKSDALSGNSFYTHQLLGQLSTSGISFDETSSTFKADGKLYYGYYKFPEEVPEKQGQGDDQTNTTVWRELTGINGTLGLKNTQGLLNSIQISAGDKPRNLDSFAENFKAIKPDELLSHITENKWGFTNANISLANSTDKNPNEEIKFGPVSIRKISGGITKTYIDSKGKNKTLPFGFFKYSTGKKRENEDVNSENPANDYGIKVIFEGTNVDLGFFTEPIKSISSVASSITDKIKPSVEFLTQTVNIANSLPGYLRTPVVEFIESTPGNQYQDNQIQVVELIDIAQAAIKWGNKKQPQSLTKPLYMVQQSLDFLESLNQIEESGNRLDLGEIKWTIPLYDKTSDAKDNAKEDLRVISIDEIKKNQDAKIATDLQKYEDSKKENKISDAWAKDEKNVKYESTFDIKFPLYKQPETFVKDLIFEDEVNLFALDLGLDYKQSYELSKRIPAFPALKIGLEGGLGLGIKTKVDAKLYASDLYNYAKNQESPKKVAEDILNNISINLDQTKASVTANLGLKIALDAILADASVSAGIEGAIALKPVLRKNNEEIGDQSISVERIRKALAEKEVFEARSTLGNISYQYNIDFSDAASQQATSNRYFSINVPFETLYFNQNGGLLEGENDQSENVFLKLSQTGWLKTESSVNQLHDKQGGNSKQTVQFDFKNSADHLKTELRKNISAEYRKIQTDTDTANQAAIDKIVQIILDRAQPHNTVEYAVLSDNQNAPTTQIQGKQETLDIFSENSSYGNVPFYSFAPQTSESDESSTITYNTGHLTKEDLKKPFTLQFTIGSTLDFEQLKDKLLIKIGDGDNANWKSLQGYLIQDIANLTPIENQDKENQYYKTMLLVFSPSTSNKFSSSPNVLLSERLDKSSNESLDISFKLEEGTETEVLKSTGIRQIVTTKNLSLGYSSNEEPSNRKMVDIAKPINKELISDQYQAVNKRDVTFYAQSAWLRPYNTNVINNKIQDTLVTDDFLKGADLLFSTDPEGEPTNTNNRLASIIQIYVKNRDINLNPSKIDFSNKIIERITIDPVTNTSYQLTVYEVEDTSLSIISEISESNNEPLDIVKIYTGLPINDITAINGNLLATRRGKDTDIDDIQIISIQTDKSLQEQSTNNKNETSYHYSIQGDEAIPKQFTESSMLNETGNQSHSLRIGLYKIKEDKFTIAVSDMSNGNVYAAAANNAIFKENIINNLNEEYRDLSVSSNKKDHNAYISDGIFDSDILVPDQQDDNSFKDNLEHSLSTIHNITPGILLGGIVKNDSSNTWINGFKETFKDIPKLGELEHNVNEYKGYLKSFDFPEFNDFEALKSAPERSFFVTYANSNAENLKTLVINTGIAENYLSELTQKYFSEPTKDGKLSSEKPLSGSDGESFDNTLQMWVNGSYEKTSVLFLSPKDLEELQGAIREKDVIETFTDVRGIGQDQDINLVSSPSVVSFKKNSTKNHLKLAYNFEKNNLQVKSLDISKNDSFPSLKITDSETTNLEQFYPLSPPYLNSDNSRPLNFTTETSIDFAGFSSTGLERLKLNGVDPNRFLLRAPTADTIQLVGADIEEGLDNSPIETKYSLLNHYYSHHDQNQQHPLVARRNQWSLPIYLKARSSDQMNDPDQNQSYFGFVNQELVTKADASNIVDYANNQLVSPQSGYQLVFTNRGGLSLFNLETNEEVWYAKNNAGDRVQGAKQAYMQPDGNFVLYEKPVENLKENGTSENGILWGSETEGNNNSSLGLTIDGTLAIFDKDNKIIKTLYTNNEDTEVLLKTSEVLNRDNPSKTFRDYQLELTEEGGLALFNLKTNEKIWFAKDKRRIGGRKEVDYIPTGASQAFMQPDGNFVLYRTPVKNLNNNGNDRDNQTEWESATNGYGANATLKISTNGTLFIDGGSSDQIKMLATWRPDLESEDIKFLTESQQLTPSNQLLTSTGKKITTNPLFNFESPDDLNPFQLTTLGANGKYESALILSGSSERTSTNAAHLVSRYAHSDPSSFDFANPLNNQGIEYDAKSIFTSMPVGQSDKKEFIELNSLSEKTNYPKPEYGHLNSDTSFMLARGEDQVPRLLDVTTSDQLLNEFQNNVEGPTSQKADILWRYLPSLRSHYKNKKEDFTNELKERYKQIDLSSKTNLLNGSPEPYIEIRDNLAYNNQLNDQTVTSSIKSDNPTELDLKLSANIDAYLRADARLLWKSINLASVRIPIWKMDPKYIATGIVFAGESKLKKNSVHLKYFDTDKFVGGGQSIGLLNKTIFAVETSVPSNASLRWLVSKPNILDTSVMDDVGLHLSTIMKKESANALTPKSSLLTMPYKGSSGKDDLKTRFDVLKRTLSIKLAKNLRPTLNQLDNALQSIQSSDHLSKSHKNYLIDNYSLLSVLKAINWLSADQEDNSQQTLKTSQKTYELFIDYLNALDNNDHRADFSSYQFYLDMLEFTSDSASQNQSIFPQSAQLAENLFHVNQILNEKIANHQGDYSSLINSISPLKSLAFDTERLLAFDFSNEHKLLQAPDFPKQKQVKFGTSGSSTNDEQPVYEMAITRSTKLTSNGISKPMSIRSDNLKYGQANDFFIDGFPDAPPSSLQIDPNQSQLKLSLKAGSNSTGNRIKGSITIQLFDRFRQVSNHNQANSLLHVFWNGFEFKSLEKWSPVRPLLRQSGVRSSNQDQNLMVRRDAHAAFKTPMALFAYEQTPASLQSTKTLAEGSLSAQLSESSQYLLLEDDLFYTRSKRSQNEDQSDRFSERELVYEFNSDSNELKTYLRPIAPQEQLADSDESISITKSEPIYFKKVPDQFRIIDTITGKPSYRKQVATLEAPVADSPSATDALTFRVKSATSKLLLDLESFVDYSYVDIQLQSPEPTSSELVFLNKDDFNLDFSDSSSVTIKSIDSPTSDSLNLRLWDQNGESLSLYNFDTEYLL